MCAKDLPSKIRVSLGSAITLGLTSGVQETETTTIYLMTYHLGKCMANCVFCSQARSSTSRSNMLSRVSWPLFPIENVINKIQEVGDRNIVKRVCVQTMNYRDVFNEVVAIVQKIHSRSSLPISITCQPLSKEQIQQLITAGVDRIGIPLDAASNKIFTRIKGALVEGPYVWERHIEGLQKAVDILGKGRVTTHFIVGLGETDRELIDIIQRMVNLGVYPSLFAFTPIPGTRYEKKAQPSIHRYRRIQLAHYLITMGQTKAENIIFNMNGAIVDFRVNQNMITERIQTGLPFMTSGCPGCNRPYYNERPSGPVYNFPFNPSRKDLQKIILGEL